MTTTLKELIAEVKQEAEKLPFYTRLPASAQASTLFFLEQMATRAYSLGEVEGRKGVVNEVEDFIGESDLHPQTRKTMKLLLRGLKEQSAENLTNK